MALRRDDRIGRPLRVCGRRPQGTRPRRDDRAGIAVGRWSLHPRHRVFEGRQPHVRLGGLRLERRRRHGTAKPSGNRAIRGRARRRRRLELRGRPRRSAGVRSGRPQQEDIRDRHPQLRRACGASLDGRRVVLDQRTRRARRRSRAGLRHARARRRLLRLAVVLYRRQRRSAPPWRTSGPQGQGDRSGRADPVALRFVADDILHRHAVPGGVPW